MFHDLYVVYEMGMKCQVGVDGRSYTATVGDIGVARCDSCAIIFFSVFFMHTGIYEDHSILFKKNTPRFEIETASKGRQFYLQQLSRLVTY